jgi:hypothetical protein
MKLLFFTKNYNRLSWNDLCAIAAKRGIFVPPTQLVESYERPTPREKMITELEQQDKQKWKFLLVLIGIITSILSFLQQLMKIVLLQQLFKH